MKLKNILLVTASVAALTACEKSDTATPEEAAPAVEEPAEAEEAVEEAAEEPAEEAEEAAEEAPEEAAE